MEVAGCSHRARDGSADPEHYPRATGVLDELAPVPVPARHLSCFEDGQFYGDEQWDDEHSQVTWTNVSLADIDDGDEQRDGDHECQREPNPLDDVPEDCVFFPLVQCFRDGLCEPEDVKEVEGDNQDRLLPS